MTYLNTLNNLIKMAVIGLTAIVISGCSSAPNNGIGQGLGAVGGAVLGGIAGNQIGGGTGKTIATGAGATLGGLFGSELGRTYDQQLENNRRRTQTNNRVPRRNSPPSSTRGCWSCDGNHPNNPGAAGAYHEGRSQYMYERQERLEDRAYERGRSGY